MYQCKGRTAEGRRCKRRVHIKNAYCSTHEVQSDSTLETLIINEGVPIFQDDDLTERLCGHKCKLTLEKCCDCTDLRPFETIDRHRDYCPLCKERIQMMIDAVRPREEPEDLNRNFLMFQPHPDENPEDAAAFRQFIMYYQLRLRDIANRR